MTISLTISVNGTVAQTFPAVPFTPGMNAQGALEAAWVQGGNYNFQLQYFGPLGYEVVGIDGIAAQQGAGVSLYWLFIYNGSPAQQGIDATPLSDGDQLGFAYTTYNPAQHAGTRLETIHRALGRG